MDVNKYHLYLFDMDIDRYRILYCRWMQWNLDVLSAVIVLAACVFTIADTATDSGDAGLCISYALQVIHSPVAECKATSLFGYNMLHANNG